jgi:hypothetical protein
VRGSGASPIVLNPSLGSRTSIGNSAPRAGNNSLPQPGYRLGPPHERVTDTVHSLSVRFERTRAWGEHYWISVAHQMLPAYVGAVSLPFGHSARLTPWVAGGKYSVWSRVVAVTKASCDRLVLGKFRLASDPNLKVSGREGLLPNPPHHVHLRLASRTTNSNFIFPV